MRREELNDELTIVGLIFLIGFLIFYVMILNQKVDKLHLESLEAKKIAVELYNQQDSYIEMLDSMNEYADTLEEELEGYSYLEKLKKDLDRNPER